MDRLPQELLSNILSTLSVKELSKCKSVCKSWLDLITTPYFITNHYLIYNNQENQHLLVLRIPIFDLFIPEPYISMFSWNTSQPKGLVSSKILSTNGYNYGDWFEIMGPCNGIFCVISRKDVLMMNPSLRQIFPLPTSHFNKSPRGLYGFGFDNTTNDYKFLALKHGSESDDGYWTSELYSLNSNTWRKLYVPTYYPIPNTWQFSTTYTFVKNCCHWWGLDVDECGNEEDYILAFDMVIEFFRKIKVPKIRYKCSKTLVLIDKYNTIGFIVYPRGQPECFDVWVMKDYFDEGSWILQYQLEPTTYYKLFGFYGNRNFIWRDGNDRLVLYEAANHNERYLQVNANNDSIRTVRYMESLVSLKRDNRQCFSSSFVPDTSLIYRKSRFTSKERVLEEE